MKTGGFRLAFAEMKMTTDFLLHELCILPCDILIDKYFVCRYNDHWFIDEVEHAFGCIKSAGGGRE